MEEKKYGWGKQAEKETQGCPHGGHRTLRGGIHVLNRRQQVNCRVDIGSSSIKVVELERAKRQLHGLTRHRALRADIVDRFPWLIADSGSVSSAISNLFSEHKIKGKSVATSVSGHSVIVKRIPTNYLSDQNWRTASRPRPRRTSPSDIQ